MHGSPNPARVTAATPDPIARPVGEFVELDGELYYRIAAYDRLAPFLMSVPSDSDLWMFVASGGGLAAGRVDADGSIFPYETVDRLHDAHHYTGPVTVIRVELDGGEGHRWEPFTEAGTENPAVERALYKNACGNRVIFEEVHRGLGLAFRYRWAASDAFGWVRSSTLENRGSAPVRISLLDGLRNILPCGAPLGLYQQSSTLVDAYKKSEVDDATGLGIFSLTAQITDRTEALEMLRANVVWCCGLENPRVYLSLGALADFRAGKVVAREDVLNGARGNYLVGASLFLERGKASSWHIAADAGKDHLQIAELRRRLREDAWLATEIEGSLDLATANLRRNVASADGLQLTGRAESWVHHFANVLFNNMRGGVFLHDYDVPVADLLDFLHVRHRAVARRHEAALAGLPDTATLAQVLELCRQEDDPDFERLCYEYLPLCFSRRHGDPSRPWNRFSIRTRNQDGGRELHFEGNWRDIFQNWEALGQSFPGFLPGMVAKFVNASTVDGFNPYRITRDGVDWEVDEPDDPWSNIGYWGDHQIIYLLKLLEALDRFDPTALGSMLDRQIFSYAEVPYRIKPYADILRDPGTTIDFDIALAERIEGRVDDRGTDGKLLTDDDGSVYHANLLEKLLVPILSKLSNLIPGAGIWMNTQRPEWNDANNALGGGGVSVVTLCYLRRHLDFLAGRLARVDATELPVSVEVVEWFDRVEVALADARAQLRSGGIDAGGRKRAMDELGGAFSAYRNAVYARGFSGKSGLALGRVVALCRTALEVIDDGIAANRRPDGLYHTYNRLEFVDDGRAVEVVHLPEMLEGQVAVLSSGYLAPGTALDLLHRLFESALYHPGVRSFLLYPQRELPGFMEKNVVPEARVTEPGLLRDLLEAGDRSLVARDADGVLRFAADLANADDVGAVLTRLGTRPEWAEPARRERAGILALFDEVFDHRSYTGRSGVMYGYEGLGCIYWHMVAKLLLAVQETCLRADAENTADITRSGLIRMYFQVRSGIGYEKTADEYGAFPTDPYSHTPGDGGARQPGMTGQVKEEILTRMGELGVSVEDGRLRFRPVLLQANEFLAGPKRFSCYDPDGTPRAIDLPTDSLAFTICQVPVVYEAADESAQIEIEFADGSSAGCSGDTLDLSMSQSLFARSGRIRRIRVSVPRQQIASA